MGFRIENNCVGCEICKHCGRDRQHVHYCDYCDANAGCDNDLYDDGMSHEVCFECLKEGLSQIYCDDCDCERCDDCGGEAEILYKIDGELLCEECLKEYADTNLRVELN